METDDLRTFVEVTEAGGVSAAARRLGVTKSVVSRQIVRLETELGVQLLSRSTRGAVVTAAGAIFREYAARICRDIDTALESIAPEGELRGRLRIAAPLTFGPTHLAPVLASMATRHPRLHIHTSYSDRFVDLLSEGFDCAIRFGYMPDSNLVARRVGPIFGKLVASPAYIRAHGAPETPDDIVEHEALMQGTESWTFMDGDRAITVRPRGKFKSDNGTALVAAALAGLGIAYLPDGITSAHVASGDLVPIMTRFPLPVAGVFVVRPPGPQAPRTVRALTDMLVECFDAHDASDDSPPPA